MPRFLPRTPTSIAAAVLGVILSAEALLGAGDAAPGADTIRASALKGHVFFLASDAMAGRDSMSHEGRIAADYIAGFFHRAGLKPVGDGNSYFQNFPMADAHIDREHTRLAARVATASGGALQREYVNGPDFTLPRQGNVDVSVSAPLVFAGYGVTAPEYNYDDFGGVDVTGKVIMVLTHEPQETDPASRFKGAWNTVHAYNWWKPEVARRHGAAAMLIVQDRVNHRPPRNASGPTNAQIRTDRGQHTLTSPFWDLPVFTITRRVADDLLAPSGKTIDQLQDAIDRAGAPQTLPVAGVTIELRRAIKDRQVVQTRNVAGVVEGSDPVLKNEYVLVTGHYDHVGQKDQFIFHGADDNASACAAVIAMAEALMSTNQRPKRSVMFLVFEAEEDGLLGAFHYVDHPIVPLDKTVAVLNMDMIGRDEDSPTWNTHAADNTNSVNVVGTLYNPDVRKVIEAENQRIGLKLDFKTDADDREGWFSRSDHYPFAIKSVPQVLFNTGEHPDYHTANDTWDRINYPKMEKITRLVYQSARTIANAAARPRFVRENTPPAPSTRSPMER